MNPRHSRPAANTDRVLAWVAAQIAEQNETLRDAAGSSETLARTFADACSLRIAKPRSRAVASGSHFTRA